MDVKRRTPRTDMAFATLARKSGPVLEALTAELPYDKYAIDTALTQLIQLSTRLNPNGAALDFELLDLSDSADDLKRKFDGFLDVESATVDDLLVRVQEADAPHDAALAPEAPPPTEKN